MYHWVCLNFVPVGVFKVRALPAHDQDKCVRCGLVVNVVQGQPSPLPSCLNKRQRPCAPPSWNHSKHTLICFLQLLPINFLLLEQNFGLLSFRTSTTRVPSSLSILGEFIQFVPNYRFESGMNGLHSHTGCKLIPGNCFTLFLQVSTLYAMAKQAKNLGGYKLARYAYEKLQALRVPLRFQEPIDLGSVTIRSKPFHDSEVRTTVRVWAVYKRGSPKWNGISREVQKSMGNYSSVLAAPIRSLSARYQAVQRTTPQRWEQRIRGGPEA